MDEHLYNEDQCVICQEEFEDSSDAILVTRGINNLIKFSDLRKDTELEAHLLKQSSTKPLGKVLIHEPCRRQYVDIKRTKRYTAPVIPHSTPKKQKLRSSQPAFQWKTNCIFCGNEVPFDDLHPDRYSDSRRVRGKKESVTMITNIREQCEERNDAFSSSVKTRVGLCSDLVAEEAVYHSGCHVRFFDNSSCSSSMEKKCLS